MIIKYLLVFLTDGNVGNNSIDINVAMCEVISISKCRKKG